MCTPVTPVVLVPGPQVGWDGRGEVGTDSTSLRRLPGPYLSLGLSLGGKVLSEMGGVGAPSSCSYFPSFGHSVRSSLCPSSFLQHLPVYRSTDAQTLCLPGFGEEGVPVPHAVVGFGEGVDGTGRHWLGVVGVCVCKTWMVLEVGLSKP